MWVTLLLVCFSWTTVLVFRSYINIPTLVTNLSWRSVPFFFLLLRFFISGINAFCFSLTRRDTSSLTEIVQPFKNLAYESTSILFLYERTLQREGNASVIIPNFSVNRHVHCSLWKNKASSDSVHILGECSSITFGQYPVQNTLVALHVHRQSCRMNFAQSTLKWFGLVLIHRFALNIQCRSGLVFPLCFLK